MTTSVNRVHDVLRRMTDNSSQSEAIKTCFGILAIMSREESNKLTIANDGIDNILSSMTAHIDKSDVQESGCDLLWSLAFNNSSVKDLIAKFGGPCVLVRALKRHARSPEFLKSACGALSNMCQSKLNQDGIASQGGLQPLVGSIHAHQANIKLLPFIFDALASLIVSNEENVRTVSSLGLIPLILVALGRHKNVQEIVKSGCHALAILSDVKGQASKIAFAGGVPIILLLLDIHSTFADLHRVASVVLLRMLQESTHVGREITCNEGVRILLKSLEKGGSQQDTVAAVTHILFTVTNPLLPASSTVESQLWLQVKKSDDTSDNDRIGTAYIKGSSSSSNTANHLTLPKVTSSEGLSNTSSSAASASGMVTITALGGVIHVLNQYKDRRDVVRATCRLLNNLAVYNGVLAALEKLSILDIILECVSTHHETRDVVESASNLIKGINKRITPVLQGTKVAAINGLVHVFRNKYHDDDAVVAISSTFTLYIDSLFTGERSDELQPYHQAYGDTLVNHLLSLCITIMGTLINYECDIITATVAPITSKASKKSQWSRSSPRVIHSILNLLEKVLTTLMIGTSLDNNKYCQEAGRVLQRLGDFPAVTCTDIVPRIDAVLLLLNNGSHSTAKAAGAATAATTTNATAASSTSSLISSLSKLSYSAHMDDACVRVAAAAALAGNNTSKSKGNGNDDDVSVTSGNSNNKGKSIYTDGNRSNKSSIQDKDTGSKNSQNQSYAAYNTCELDSNLENHNTYNIDINTKRLIPRHPLKYRISNDSSSSSNSSSSNSTCTRLLETWPNFLERLNPQVFTNMIHRYSSPSALDRMHVCYEARYAGGKGLTSRVPTPVPYTVPIGGLGDVFEHSLSFDSEFESGNLLRTVQRGDANYDLFLRADLHTAGHTQWFYFAVSNTHPPALVRLSEQGVQVPPVRVRFNIVNLTKPDSLFNLGMRPVLYSCEDASSKNIGWIRSGSEISYYCNPYVRNNTAGEGVACYYTLSFTLEFTHPKDTVLIAYSYPYTLGNYRMHLQHILSKASSHDMIKSFKLCTTLGGEDCDLLVITNFKDKECIGPITIQQMDAKDDGSSKKSASGTTAKQRAATLKPALFFSCRVHPGETPASWMMKGMLDFLTSDTSQAVLLRNVYVIFIVPMLNPDGVVYGNNRCSLSGVDLNRQWKLPMKALHPTVYHLKLFMSLQKKIRDVNMYIDLHGHSRKYNVFMYGNEDKKKSKPQVRAFPRFFSMHQIGQKYVCYQDCSFHVKKGRESTARVVANKELNIPCSFTLEATFCGANYGPLKHCHMNIGHLQEVGAALCDAILNFSISEGYVRDTITVPGNVKAVAQIEQTIAIEDGVPVRRSLELSDGKTSAATAGSGGGSGSGSVDSTKGDTVILSSTAMMNVGDKLFTAASADDALDYDSGDDDESYVENNRQQQVKSSTTTTEYNSKKEKIKSMTSHPSSSLVQSQQMAFPSSLLPMPPASLSKTAPTVALRTIIDRKAKDDLLYGQHMANSGNSSLVIVNRTSSSANDDGSVTSKSTKKKQLLRAKLSVRSSSEKMTADLDVTFPKVNKK